MSLTEDRRRLLYDRVAQAIGADLVDDFMNHLSPHPLADLATRDDVRASETVTRAEVAALRGEIHVEIAALRIEFKADMAELRTDMAELRTELKDDMAELRTDMSRRFDALTRWSAGLVAANLATVVTVLVA